MSVDISMNFAIKSSVMMPFRISIVIVVTVVVLFLLVFCRRSAYSFCLFVVVPAVCVLVLVVIDEILAVVDGVSCICSFSFIIIVQHERKRNVVISWRLDFLNGTFQKLRSKQVF